MVLGFGSMSVAHAQSVPPNTPDGDGVVSGVVARCVNGDDSPLAQVGVGVQGGTPSLVRSNSAGVFQLFLAPGQYTVVATLDDGSTAAVSFVPVTAGQTIDIGYLEFGAGPFGCGGDAGGGAAAAATVAPTATSVPPTAVPTATSVPPTAVPTVVPPTAVPDDSGAPPADTTSDSGS
jgi:hypothetical protein